MGGQEDAIKGTALSLQAHRGHHRRWRNGYGKNLHRRRRRPRRRFPAGAHIVSAPPHSKVEAGGGGYRPPSQGRHRHLHHRPGKAQAVRGSRPPLRHYVPGKGQAVLPLAACRDPSGGPPPGDGWCGTSRRANPSGCPAAPPATPRWWTRMGFPLPTRSSPASAATATCAAPPSGRPTAPAPNGIHWRDYVKVRMKGFFDLLIGR